MSIDLMNNEFYNAYADSFDKIPFEDVLIPLILKHLPSSHCNVLEIGSGTGALALWMSKKLGHNITYIEPAEKPVKKIHRCQKCGVEMVNKIAEEDSQPDDWEKLIKLSREH